MEAGTKLLISEIHYVQDLVRKRVSREFFTCLPFDQPYLLWEQYWSSQSHLAARRVRQQIPRQTRCLQPQRKSLPQHLKKNPSTPRWSSNQASRRRRSVTRRSKHVSRTLAWHCITSMTKTGSSYRHQQIILSITMKTVA